MKKWFVFLFCLNEKHFLFCSMHMCCIGMCTRLNMRKVQ